MKRIIVVLAGSLIFFLAVYLDIKFLFLLAILGFFLFYRSRYSLSEGGKKARREAVLKRKELRSLIKEVDVSFAIAGKYPIEPQPEGDLLRRAKNSLQKAKDGFKSAEDPRKRRKDPNYYEGIKISYSLYLLYAGVAREVLRRIAVIFEKESREELSEADSVVSSALRSEKFKGSTKAKQLMFSAKHSFSKAQQTNDPIERLHQSRRAIEISKKVISGNFKNAKAKVVAVQQETS